MANKRIYLCHAHMSDEDMKHIVETVKKAIA